MAYTTINKSSDYFNTLLYTGDGSGSNRSLTGVGFQPDWVWNKSRSNAYNHYLFDAPRGAGKRIGSNSNAVEDDKSAEFISFDSDGFTVNNNGSSLAINASGVTFVNWCWKGGTTSGITTNSDTSITPSAYSFNQTSGFSIIKYTGTAVDGAYLPHGLGKAPELLLLKSTSLSESWQVYSKPTGNQGRGHLDNGDAFDTSRGEWYSTNPDTVNMRISNDSHINSSGATYIAYFFTSIKGFSKIGSYTGNSNVNGPFIYCGFKPAFVLIKNISTSNHWLIIDNKRSVFNLADDALFANESSAEQADQSSASGINIVSNGFKIRTTGNAAANYNNNDGDTYIFAAFAEAPLVGSNNIPCTAR
jgi:hypothetical protein